MRECLLAESGGFDFGALTGALLTAAAVIGVSYLGWRLKQKEAAALRTWAARYGYHYERRDDSAMSVSSAPPFGTGNDPKCTDVFRGTYKNTRVLFFQYEYKPVSQHQSSSATYQVVAIGLPSSLPLLDIGRERFLARRGEDIDFENQRFNDAFKIQSPDRRFAFDVIHPRTMEWMLADRRTRSYQWRFEGPWLMSYRLGEIDLEDVFARADFLLDIRAQVPGHVWSSRA